ncbi:hypothetical protein LDENG_00113390 [Lucifuga dentata]|nr:hypothetical protein LDENG_00113390 [Lucifuga dentata]
MRQQVSANEGETNEGTKSAHTAHVFWYQHNLRKLFNVSRWCHLILLSLTRHRREEEESVLSYSGTDMITLRKQMNQDANDIPSGSRQNNDETQEDECAKGKDDKDECSSSLPASSSLREKRRREREKKQKSREMTEEDMMDLALHLSEKEASIAAVKQQQEEEAMIKVIEESMVSQTQQCPPSQSLLADTDASLTLSSRRKFLYPIRNARSRGVCSSNTDISQDPKGTGAENNRGKKRKRKDGSPLLEMPDLSQTQKIESQTSPISKDPLDSSQSSDSTQIEDYHLQKSPVFPLSPSMACKPEVHISRLSQEMLETCRTSGYVLCSQESWTSAHQSLPAQPNTCPEYCKSPVFDRTSPNKKPPHACKPKASDCNPSCNNSGFVFCSQESLASSTKSTSCHPRSLVFPQSPSLSKILALSESPASPKSPAFSETDQGQDGKTQQSCGYSTSPVFGRTDQQQMIGFDEQNTVVSSAAEHEDSPTCSCDGCNGSHQDIRDLPLPRCLRKRNKIDPYPEDTIIPSKSVAPAPHPSILANHAFPPLIEANLQTKRKKCEGEKKDRPDHPKDAQESNEVSKDWNSVRTELTSNMNLHWSDEDDDAEVEGTPSPVFPEERAIHQPDRQSAAHHVAAAPASPRLNYSPNLQRCGPVTGVEKAQHFSTFTKDGISAGSSSSSMLLCQQQQQLHSTTEREAHLVHSQGPVAMPTVHYYWGVPFCPRGLDPDAYTQVILAQLEVYEKSLKQAQRCLLRKAEWGEAILPQPEKSPSPESPGESPEQPIPRRRGLRLRGKRTCETRLAEAEGDKKDDEEEEERQRRNKEEEEEEGEVDIDDCEVCPETELSDNDDDSKEDLTVATDAGAEPKAKSPELPQVEFTLRDEPSDQEESQEVMEVDGPVEGEPKGDVTVSNAAKRPNLRVEEEEEGSGNAKVEEIKDQELQLSMSPELEQAAAPQISKPTIDCPICQGSFSVTEIELHAAYCDGEVTVIEERRSEADCFEVSLKPRWKRSRKPEVTTEETSDPSLLHTKADHKQEKCYVCQKAVLLRDYSRHTEDCIQRRTSNAAPRGNLLSALEQTESRDSDAGPSGSNLQPRDIIDLRNEEDSEETTDVSSFRISHSPIRSFTPISQATDCLIDFKKQQRVKKPIQRP